jgi:SNF2 family DNA or RNA helicase
LPSGHRVLIFSQFTSHLALVREAIAARGIRHLYLDGATPASERWQLVQQFQAGFAEVFLISLRAGGTGLNLTAADYVVHMDPWWNPAVEDQASDRAHRIGQERPVTIIKLVTRNTVEEHILDVHERKRWLARSLLSGGATTDAFDEELLAALLKPDEPNFAAGSTLGWEKLQ